MAVTQESLNPEYCLVPRGGSSSTATGASQVLSNEQGTIPQPGGLAEISRGLSEAIPPVRGQTNRTPAGVPDGRAEHAATLPGSSRVGSISGGIVAARLNPRLMSGIAPRCSA